MVHVLICTVIMEANRVLQTNFNQISQTHALIFHFQLRNRYSGISFRQHLTKVVANTTLTFEEANTLLCQIYVVLNSCPITPLSSNPSVYSARTPLHILVGGLITLLRYCFYQMFLLCFKTNSNYLLWCKSEWKTFGMIVQEILISITLAWPVDKVSSKHESRWPMYPSKWNTFSVQMVFGLSPGYTSRSRWNSSCGDTI